MKEQKIFNPKEEAKLLTAISKFADYSLEPISQEECLKLQNSFFTDKTSVCLIEAVSERAKKIIYKFIDKEQTREFPNSIINDLKGSGEIGCKFSTEYLLTALKIFDSIKMEVKLLVKKDFPMILESEDFRIIIAPRVEYD